MNLPQMVVWKNRDNISTITLKVENTILTPTEMGAITKASIGYNGIYYDSVDYPEAFDLTTGVNTAEIYIRPGLFPLTVGNGVAQLIIFLDGSTHGIVWSQFAMQIKDDAMI